MNFYDENIQNQLASDDFDAFEDEGPQNEEGAGTKRNNPFGGDDDTLKRQKIE